MRSGLIAKIPRRSLVGRSLVGMPTEAIRYEQLLRMAEALLQLTEEQRRVVGLRFWKDCKLSEIAAQMGRSEQAVAKLLQRALKKLREILGRDDLE